MHNALRPRTTTKTFNFLKRSLTTSGAAILFCLCNVLFQTASQLQTQIRSTTKRFLVTYRCIAKRYEALCNVRLMQLAPDLCKFRSMRGVRKEIYFFSELCSNATDKAQLSFGLTYLSELVLKQVQPTHGSK